MPIKITLAELERLSHRNPVDPHSTSTFQRFASMKIRAVAAHAVAKMLHAATAELQDLEAQRNRLITELGTPNGNGAHSIEPGTEAMTKFFDEFNELRAKEIELPVDPLPLAALGDAEITTADLIALAKFVRTEPETQEATHG